MIERLSILGVGLLGGSIGLAARARGVRVTGWGRSAQAVRAALDAGAVADATVDLRAAVAEAELVVVCVPVGNVADLARRVAPHLPAGCVMTDVGSTKASIVAACEETFPRFVGSHPMAGSERTGAAAARSDLFDGATCVVTPTPRSDAAAVARVTAFWQGLGLRVVTETPEDHDWLVGLVSHLPHAVAAALAASQSSQSRRLAGPGYRDTTRIAAGDPALWRDIFLDNADALEAAVGRFEAEMLTLKQALVTRDAHAIEAFLRRAASPANGRDIK